MTARRLVYNPGEYVAAVENALAAGEVLIDLKIKRVLRGHPHLALTFAPAPDGSPEDFEMDAFPEIRFPAVSRDYVVGALKGFGDADCRRLASLIEALPLRAEYGIRLTDWMADDLAQRFAARRDVTVVTAKEAKVRSA